MEMVSDKGIQYNNEKTLHMLHIDEGETLYRSNSLEVTKIAWHAQLNLSKKYQDRYRRYQHGLPGE